MDTEITKIRVFDFDQTIVETPLPDKGREDYKLKTGKDWPHIGWWGKPESLDMEIFDIKANPSVVADYKKSMADPESLTFLLTGRMTRLGEFVKKILDSLNLPFDGYFFNNGGSTDVAKVRTLTELLTTYPTVTDVELWDDRQSHQAIFNAWGKEQLDSGRITHFKLNLVLNDNLPH